MENENIYDYTVLLGKMKEQRYTIRSLAEAAGVPEATLYRTLAGKRCFDQSQIEKVSKPLNIPKSQIGIIFFTQRLRNTKLGKETT